MISTVRGRFGGVAGAVTLDEKHPANSKIDIEVDIASIDTRQEQRDAHLRSADFFDAEKFPTMRFVGRKVEGDITGDFAITGDLTIRGTTRPITLEVTAEGRGRDPWGNDRAGFSAKGKFHLQPVWSDVEPDARGRWSCGQRRSEDLDRPRADSFRLPRPVTLRNPA